MDGKKISSECVNCNAKFDCPELLDYVQSKPLLCSLCIDGLTCVKEIFNGQCSFNPEEKEIVELAILSYMKTDLPLLHKINRLAELISTSVQLLKGKSIC